MPQASSDTGFLTTVGVNTSITMISSAYQNYGQMLDALSYIGVNQLRDTYDNPFSTAEFAQMGRQLGLKFDFFIALGSASPEWQLAQIETNASIAAYVEGYNESDAWWQTFHGATGVAATQAVQKYIYDGVKLDPALAGVGVIQATFVAPASFAAYGNMSADTDYASTHTYFGTGNSPSGSAASLIAQSQTISPGRPTITTEAGYFTMPGNPNGVSQTVQAKYELDFLFEQATAGVKLTYLWDLADNYADPDNTNPEDHFGLFNNDWTPKLAAIALHNTMAIMADPGTGGVAPGTLNYSFDALPRSVQTALFQKSDGTFVLVVWNDVRLSGPTVQGDIVVPAIPTTLHLGQSFAHIATFDPLTGTAATQSFAGASDIDLQIVDHPLIIELSQNPAFPIPSSILEAPTQLITTPHTEAQVEGLLLTSGATGTIAVRLHANLNALSVLDTAGHLLASDTTDLVLTGSVATVNAELATVEYRGGPAVGSDVISVTITNLGGAPITRDIAVLVAPETGALANDSGGPALSVPAQFSSAPGVPIALVRLSVADPYADTHAGAVSLSVKAASGILQVPYTGASVFGAATTSLLVSGSFAQVAAALSEIVYTAAVGAAWDTISYSFTDQTGFSASATTQITVGNSLGGAPVTTTLSLPTAVPVVASSESAVYRFFDSKTGTQFLTSSATERDTVLATRPDLVSEGVGIGALNQPSGDADAISVYRFFDTQSGTHFYTASSAERDGLQATRADLTYEGVSFYEHQNAMSNDTAVYRFFNENNGTHFFTASAPERSAILATRSDLKPEGIAFYAPTT